MYYASIVFPFELEFTDTTDTDKAASCLKFHIETDKEIGKK